MIDVRVISQHPQAVAAAYTPATVRYWPGIWADGSSWTSVPSAMHMGTAFPRSGSTVDRYARPTA